MSRLRKSKGLKMSKPLGATANFFILERGVVRLIPSRAAVLGMVFDELSVKVCLSRRARLPCKPQPRLDS